MTGIARSQMFVCVVALATVLLAHTAASAASPQPGDEAKADAAIRYRNGTNAAARAKRLEMSGDATGAKVEWANAAREFDAAYNLVPDPNLLWGAARCYYLAGDLPTALRRYTDYAALPGIADRERTEAKARLDEITSALIAPPPDEAAPVPGPEPAPHADPPTAPVPEVEPAPTDPVEATPTGTDGLVAEAATSPAPIAVHETVPPMNPEPAQPGRLGLRLSGGLANTVYGQNAVLALGYREFGTEDIRGWLELRAAWVSAFDYDEARRVYDSTSASEEEAFDDGQVGRFAVGLMQWLSLVLDRAGANSLEPDDRVSIDLGAGVSTDFERAELAVSLRVNVWLLFLEASLYPLATARTDSWNSYWDVSRGTSVLDTGDLQLGARLAF